MDRRRRQASPKTLHLDVVDIRGTLFHGPRSENARNEKGALLFSQLSLGPLQCSLNFNPRTGSYSASTKTTSAGPTSLSSPCSTGVARSIDAGNHTASAQAGP